MRFLYHGCLALVSFKKQLDFQFMKIMKKIFLSIFATVLLLASCTNDDIDITTTPKIRTVTYVVNTQPMYDELGITSEISSNYLSKGYSIGVYTFIYDSNGNKVGSKSFTTSALSSQTEEFKMEEGSYTFVTYETLVGNGNTPSWSGDDKLTTLVFDDKSSSDYHFISGKVQTAVTIKGGDQTASVTPGATQVLLSYNINTQSIYNEFGVATRITDNYLRDKAAAIGLFTYIYNASGDLVDSVATQQFSLNTASQIRSLAKGNYTIVTVETLVDTDNNNQSDSWSINDSEKLSTLKISQKKAYMGYTDVVGIYTTTANINSNTSLSAIPKAIGSFIRFHSYNIENSPFVYVGFGTSDILDYYSINPQLSRDSKFVEDLSQSGIFNLRGYLPSEDIIAGYYNIIYIVESNIIPKYAAQDEQIAGTSTWSTWIADKENLEDGKIYDAGFYYLYSEDTHNYAAKYFGDAIGLAAWKAEYDEYVKTLTNNTLYEEPYTTWGGTVAAVKSFMSGYQVGNNGNLEESDNYYVLWYRGKYKEAEIDYYFTSPTGGLTDALVFFDASTVGEDDLSKAFTEMGYTLITSGDGYSAYLTKDSNSFVLVQLNKQNYWVLDYFSATSTSAPRRALKKNFQAFAPNRQSAMSFKNYDKVCIVKELRKCEDMMKFYSK